MWVTSQSIYHITTLQLPIFVITLWIASRIQSPDNRVSVTVHAMLIQLEKSFEIVYLSAACGLWSSSVDYFCDFWYPESVLQGQNERRSLHCVTALTRNELLRENQGREVVILDVCSFTRNGKGTTE